MRAGPSLPRTARLLADGALAAVAVRAVPTVAVRAVLVVRAAVGVRAGRLRLARPLALATRSPPSARTRAPFALEQRLAGEADLAAGIDVDDLDQDLVAFLDLAAHVLHAVVGHLAHVQEAVRAG